MKLQIRTWYQFGCPYHAIENDKGEIILKLSFRNYKLARKIKEFLLKNPKLLE